MPPLRPAVAPPGAVPRRLRAAATTLLLAVAAVPGFAGELTAESARAQVEAEVATLPSEKARIERGVVIAFIRENTSPPLRRAAREFLADFDARMIVDRTIGFFETIPPDRQVEMLDLFDECYPDLRGYDFRLNTIVGRATASPDREVRRGASRLAGRYKIREAYFPLRRRANRSSGEDRIEAIRTLGQMADPRAIWFLPDLLKSKDPEVVETTIESLARLGRASSVVLKEQIASGHPIYSQIALRSLMAMPAIDDLPVYYSYIQSHPGLQDPLKSDLYDLVARLEVARDKGLEAPRD